MRPPPAPILFEDNHLLVVDKPAGMLTQPTPKCPKASKPSSKNG